MRIRTTTIAVAAGVLAGSMLFSQAAGARTTRPRTVHGTYASPVIGAAGFFGAAHCSQTDDFGCVVFHTRPTERHATISIKDQSGQPVYAQYGWNKQTPGSNTPGTFMPLGDFCGKTRRPVAIKGSRGLAIFVYEGPGPNGCVGVASQGAVTVRLSA